MMIMPRKKITSKELIAFISHSSHRNFIKITSKGLLASISHSSHGKYIKIRKAQAYSLFAILIMIPVLLFFTQYIVFVQTPKTQTLEKIVSDQLHHVQRNIEKDFEKGFEISVKRAFLGTLNHVISTGDFVDSAVLRILEQIFYGTLYGNQSYYMINNTLEDWRQKILSIDTAFNISLAYSIWTIKLKKINGTFYDGTINIEANVSDNLNTAKIARNVPVNFQIDIEGFEDPVYALNTFGYIKRAITLSPYTYYAKKLVTGSMRNGNCSGMASFNTSNPDPTKIIVAYNITNVSGFLGGVGEVSEQPLQILSCYTTGAANAVNLINDSITQTNYSRIYLDESTSSVWHLPIYEDIEKKYYQRGLGPDFFKRLEGNLSLENPPNIGIQSLVDTNELVQAGLTVYPDRSIFDALYFSNYTNETLISGFPVRGLQSWVRIDNDSAAAYNFSELLVK